MYSLEDVNKCRDVIIRILRGTQREGIENVLAYMDENGFYSAAASCKFHNPKLVIRKNFVTFK